MLLYSLFFAAELVNDPAMSSLDLSKKLGIPLSTIQRRRAKLEKSMLKRTSSFDYRAFGGREGDLILNVDKGKSKEVAQYLLKNYKVKLLLCIPELTHYIMSLRMLFTRILKNCMN